MKYSGPNRTHENMTRNRAVKILSLASRFHAVFTSNFYPPQNLQSKMRNLLKTNGDCNFYPPQNAFFSTCGERNLGMSAALRAPVGAP